MLFKKTYMILLKINYTIKSLKIIFNIKYIYYGFKLIQNKIVKQPFYKK